MQIPATLKSLPEECILISYDCEAADTNKPNFVPGSCMSIGAVYMVFSKDAPFRHAYNNIFFQTMEPEIPMTNPKTLKFWGSHPTALGWNTETDNSSITAAFANLAAWALGVADRHNLPLVFLAAPHDYDVQHLLYGLSFTSHAQNTQELEGIALFADSAELYATHHNLPQREGKSEFKHLFMPKNLVHEPVLDSMVQLSATVAGLLYQRPAGPPVTGAETQNPK